MRQFVDQLFPTEPFKLTFDVLDLDDFNNAYEFGEDIIVEPLREKEIRTKKRIELPLKLFLACDIFIRIT